VDQGSWSPARSGISLFAPKEKDRVKNELCPGSREFSKVPLFSPALPSAILTQVEQLTRTHLKNRILVQDRGGVEFIAGGILLYVEDLKRGTNKDIGPKDIFEMGSSKDACPSEKSFIDP
jgi:hypothetical protein